MNRFLTTVIVFAVVIFLAAHIGFYKKYIALFPGFEGVDFVVHYHSTMMFLWLALIVIQPILIAKKYFKAHRIIGRMTYLIAPLLLLSMVMIVNYKFLRTEGSVPLVDALAGLSVNVPDYFAFAILYSLAIIYKKNTDWHSRFMISTTFVVIGAAFVRILIRNFGIESQTAFGLVAIIADVLCLIFLIADIRTNKYKPFLIALVILLIEHGIWLMRYTDAWQSLAKSYVDIFIHWLL